MGLFCRLGQDFDLMDRVYILREREAVTWGGGGGRCVLGGGGEEN